MKMIQLVNSSSSSSQEMESNKADCHDTSGFKWFNGASNIPLHICMMLLHCVHTAILSHIRLPNLVSYPCCLSANYKDLIIYRIFISRLEIGIKYLHDTFSMVHKGSISKGIPMFCVKVVLNCIQCGITMLTDHKGWFTGLVIAVLFSHTGALPINDTNHGDKIHIFPKLTSPWFKFKNPETEYTCPNVDKKFNFTIYLREYKCRDWEEIICMDSVSVGRVFFCIPKSTSCSIGIGWTVEAVDDKDVIVKESFCQEDYYQSEHSECYNACKTKHEPLELIPPLKYLLHSKGDNKGPTMLTCNAADGFYNPHNITYVAFDSNLPADFCTNVNIVNPCAAGYMPLYNGTCLDICSQAYQELVTSSRCKALSGKERDSEIKDVPATLKPADQGGVSTRKRNNDDMEDTSGDVNDTDDKNEEVNDVAEKIHRGGIKMTVVKIVVMTVALFIISPFLVVVVLNLAPTEDCRSSKKENCLIADDDDGSDSTVDEDSTSESKVDDETEMDTQTEVHENSPSKSSCRKIKKKYRNNLFLAIDKIGTINLGSVSSNEDTSALMKSLCDELQIPEESVKSFFVKKMDSEKILSETDEEGNGQEEELSQDVETLTPKMGENVTSEVDRGAGEEFASPHCKTLTQLVVNGFAEYMKSVGALIYKGDVMGTVFRAGDDYLITAFHVIRRIIDQHNTGMADFRLIEAENVFINFNASVCETPEYKFRVRHVLSTDTPRLDYTVLQIWNRNDALPKGLKLDKMTGNNQINKLHGIGYGDPENPFCKVLDNSCLIIPSINTRILDCEKWLHDTNRGLHDQNLPPVAQNGANAGLTRVQYFKAHFQMMGSDPDIVDKGYQGIDRDQHIFSDICLEHRGSGSPFLTSDGIVKGILTYGHPEFYYLLPKIVKASFPSDKRFECILKIEYVYQNILRQDPDLANKLFG